MKLLNRFGYAPAIVTPRLAAFGAVLLLTRVLSPEQFGLYALVIVYGEMLDAVSLSWSRLGVQRYFHTNGVDAGHLRMTGAMVAVVGGVGGAALGAVLAFGNAATSFWAFYLVLLLYFIGAGVLREGLNILRAEERVVAYVALECARPMIGLGAAWALAAHCSTTFAAASIGMFGTTALFAIAALFLTRRGPRQDGTEIELAEFLRYSAPLALVFLVSQLISAGDRYFLGVFSGPAAVGIYAACTALARPPIEMLFNVVNTQAFPRLLKAYEQHGEGAAAHELQGQLGLLVLMGLPALVGLWLMARPMSEVLLAPEYRTNADWIIRLSALAAFLANFKCFFSDQVFHLRKKSLIQTSTLVPGAAVSVAGCVATVPLYGGVGAAASLVLGYGIAAALSLAVSRRYLPIAVPWALVSQAVLGCAAMSAVSWLIGPSHNLATLLAVAFACALVYAVVSVSTGATRALARQPV